VQRKRDGDGDGFVDDGTPMERPWNPLTDIKPKRTVYHLTDKARFKLNPKKVPADNALAIRQRDAAGIYVAKDKYDVETWVNGHGYLRPYVVEMEVPEEVLADERWSGEGFIPGDKFDQVEVKRVIPIDAHSRETYGDYGWVESTLGSKFDDGAPTPERMFDQPYDGLPPGYRYDGPDVRDMSPEETKRLAAGARVARKARGSGKNATEDPFAAPEAPIKVLRRPAYVNVGPEHRKVTEDTFFPGDSWSTMGVPELPTEILHWAVYGGNMTGLNGLDHDDDTSETMSMSISAERLLRHLGYGAYVNQRLNAKLNDDEYAFHMENVWLQLTQTQDARRALSRAAHDGPSGEEAAFYRFVHQWFLQQTADDGDTEPVRRYFLRSWDDPQPRMKGGRKPKPVTEDPFAPGSRWKEQGERPSAAGSGLTSWNSLDRGPFGHPIKYAGMSGDDPYWEGDAPKDQILGRFGDVEDEVIIARDKATLDRLLGTEANPFTPVDAPGELGRAASGWDGAVWRVPDEFDVWSREVPILPDRLLEWAARGANLGGLRNFDDNRLRNLRQLANDILSARRSGVPDDEMGDAHEKLWTWLTRRQDSRQALSRAIHDGPTAEERELYGIMHQHFLDYAERRWPEWGDVVPAQRASTEDGPFDPNHGWKKQAERPKGGGSGFTSWDAMDYDEPYGHELRPRRDRRGTTVWVGDVPKSQVLGRFGDTENELIVASDPATLQRLIGENPNPFTEVVGDPDVALGSGRGSDAPYPGCAPSPPTNARRCGSRASRSPRRGPTCTSLRTPTPPCSPGALTARAATSTSTRRHTKPAPPRPSTSARRRSPLGSQHSTPRCSATPWTIRPPPPPP
jgi:hypothetical protein